MNLLTGRKISRIPVGRCVGIVLVLFCYCGNVSFADSSFGVTAEEIHGESGMKSGKRDSGSQKSHGASSIRQEISEGEFRLKECTLPSHLICLPGDCSTDGGAKQENFTSGRVVVGSWDKKGAAATWQLDVPESGEYVVEMICAAPKPEGTKMLFKAGKEAKPFSLPRTCQGALFSQAFPIGSFVLEKGKQNVSLHLEEDAGKALWLDSVRIIPKRDWVEGIKLYPENFYRLNGLRFDRNKQFKFSLPVLWGSKSLANLICWRVDVPKTGRYRVELDYTCATPGWKARLILGISSEFVWQVPAMAASENSWKTLSLGECSLKAGQIAIRISAEDKSSSDLRFMDIYSIRLIPVEVGEQNRTALEAGEE